MSEARPSDMMVDGEQGNVQYTAAGTMCRENSDFTPTTTIPKSPPIEG